MSDFSAIRAISESLRILIGNNIVLPGVTVTEQSPSDMELAGINGVSVWLYKVTRHEFTLNQTVSRPTLNQRAHPPLPVTLHYLISFNMNDALDEQLLLGRILQLFNDAPQLSGSNLQGSLIGSDDVFRIRLEMLTLEELTRIWNALQQPYRISITYQVDVVLLDSARPYELTTPVIVRESTMSQIVAEMGQ
jgi:hypothetical protein